LVRLLSLPLIVTASSSILLGLFFFVLQRRLKVHHKEAVAHYNVFVLLATVTGTFLGSFAVLLNVGDDLELLNVANRITIISSMFTVVLAVEFVVRFFDYRPPVSLAWCYGVNALFSLICIFPNRYFLDKAFYVTSKYYTGLEFGVLFQVWGVWVVLISLYCILVLYLAYRQIQTRAEHQSVGPVLSLLAVTTFWLITGIGDDLTAVQVIDLPPLAWIGAFLITFNIAGILILQIDTLYKERRELSNQLIRDYLTQTCSRSYFEIRVKQAVASLKSGQVTSVCMCLLDVDDFKSVNDTYGHIVGDSVLKAIGEVVSSSVRSTDCAARLGGDEFAVLLPGIPRDPVALQIVGRIRERVNQLVFPCNEREVRVTCSFGVSRIDGSHSGRPEIIEELMASADEALYSAKRAGKNAIESHSLAPVADTLPPSKPKTP
jgi:diguanylate cyclase (GGDEF)-like protein